MTSPDSLLSKTTKFRVSLMSLARSTSDYFSVLVGSFRAAVAKNSERFPRFFGVKLRVIFFSPKSVETFVVLTKCFSDIGLMKDLKLFAATLEVEEIHHRMLRENHMSSHASIAVVRGRRGSVCLGQRNADDVASLPECFNDIERERKSHHSFSKQNNPPFSPDSMSQPFLCVLISAPPICSVPCAPLDPRVNPFGTVPQICR